MKKFKYILIILLSVFANQSVFAAIERFSNRLEGTALTAGSTLSLYDDKYYDMSTDPFWSMRFSNKKSTGTVRIGINPDVPVTSDFSASQLVEITYWTWNATTATFVSSGSITKAFGLEYQASGTSIADDQTTFVIPGAHRISVKVLNGTLPLNQLFLETSIEVERYYVLDNNPVINLKHAPLNVAADGPQIEFSWDTKAGAEFYELEWVHINDYKLDPQNSNDYLFESQLNYNFYLNSTRIETKQNWYKIPRIFDHGYIVYRVRAIGKKGTNFTDRQDGTWTAVESGLVSSFSGVNKIHITDEFSGINWSHNVVYAEDGKRFEGVSYADGLGRAHQSLAHNPVTNQVIVSNVYYDELGRAAVGDLPTPVSGAFMKYRDSFNLVDETTIPYSRNNFDPPLVDGCQANSIGFSTTSGAGKYYSPSNPDQNGANVAIPDAEKYPFSRVTFMNDYTNRVASISAAGEDLKTGSGKETKIFYPSSNQYELNQLFGTEVGWAPHYTKMITVDPNGQIYVQYTDMAGRTVLSYMEGPSPGNVDGVGGNSSTDLDVVMIEDGSPRLPANSISYSEISYSQYISSDTVFNFNYSFTPAQFQSACTGNLCLDCIYDLEIEVFDDCGAPVILNGYTNPVHIIGSDIDDLINGTCNGINVHDEAFSAHLNPGMYTIHKKLTVNEDAIDAYWCLYLEANTCIEGVQSIFNEAYMEESFAACNPTMIDDTPESTCDGYKQIMLTDVSPGGQYGTYNETTWISNDAYSVFNPSGALGVNWRTLTYLDENNVAVPASRLAGTAGLEWFVSNFREEWAEVLVSEHPEYCYLEFCYLNESSNKYDEEMLAINSYETALSEGYIMPLAGGIPNSYYTFFPSPSTSIPSNPDPFFLPDSLGAAYYNGINGMLGGMNTYVNDLHGSIDLSMWEYAVYLVSGEECRKDNMNKCLEFDACNKDLIWLTFRNLYLADKHTKVFLAQQAYAEANGCSNKCIGAVGTVAGCGSFPQSVLATRSPRFGNTNAFAFDIDTITTEQSAYNVINPMIAESCSTSCEGYAEQWLEDLAGCAPIAGLDSIQRKALKDEFIELCMLGCDSEHPMGATTAPVGKQTQHGKTDIKGVLDYHLSGKAGYPDPSCSQYLVTFPGPYKEKEEMLTAFSRLDQCGCDILMDVRTDYQAGIANGTILPTTSIEAYLNVYKGIDMEDVDNLLCVCDQFYDEGNDQWPANANAQIVAAKKLVPRELTCEANTACKSCDEINAKYTAAYNFAYTTYGLNSAAFEAASNYETILTNFLNEHLGYDLKFKDYDFFHKGCNATSSNPVCEMNPIMDEFKKILAVQALRGKLVHASTLNLVVENIVYKHGELFEKELLGSSYKGTVNGGHLTLSFQNGSQTPCTFDLSVAAKPNFDFSKIVSFGEMWPTSTNCTANSNFELEVKYYECGQLVTALAQVTNTCLQVNWCYCGDNGQRLCNEPLFDPNFEICYQPVLDNLMQDAIEEYELSVTEAYLEFQTAYKTKCAAAFSTENFRMRGKFRYYQYTQFYYDQAGNLVRTVAPKGVDKMLPSENEAINESRKTIGTPMLPEQTFETKYRYNSYGQLVATSNPDQQGETKFWYDFYGRIALSQNPVQFDANKYSYIFYDKYGRPEEAGQVVPATALNETALLKVQDPVSTVFKAWVKASGSTRTEVTRTYYDKVAIQAVQSRFTLQPGQTQPGQQNLRLRVASVAYYNTVTSDLVTGYASATHYTYDLHGNVLQTLQDVPELAPVKQDIKSTEYEFELISGNVKTVKYQKDKRDQMTHTYIYDRANRLEEVFVSTDKIHQSRQAHYLYYDYGPLARVELGEQKVQGMDYAYTINGWMKAMNGTVLNPGYELGRDNASGYLSQNTSVHSKVARDVVGYTLGYFNGDYQSIGSTNFTPSPYTGVLNTAISPLYNGNIAYTTTAIADVPNSGIQMGIQMGVYRYDQMNRLVGTRTFRASGLAASNSWTGVAETSEYASTYSYDANGNLTHLQRNGSAANLNMDKFDYNFEEVANTPPAIGTHPSNRLDYVKDAPSYSGYYSEDIDNQSIDNYGYDKLGQLIRDNSEGSMLIEWFTGSRKVKKITRSGKTIEFKYSPLGQRLLKKVTNTTTGAITTSYYAYDANGQVMGVYDLNLTTNTAKLNELNIYGASRLGMIDRDIDLCINGTEQTAPVYPPVDPAIHTLGYKKYEITNYLGNVNVVITDRKVYVGGTYEAVVIMNSDYYPFGMEMPNRHNSEDKYRFGYNGMEMDNEAKGNGNSYTTEFRQYDPRLGRWLSLDPLMRKYPGMSPYVAFNNNPIFFTDPLGLEGEPEFKEPNPDAGSEYADGKGYGLELAHDWEQKNVKGNAKTNIVLALDRLDVGGWGSQVHFDKSTELNSEIYHPGGFICRRAENYKKNEYYDNYTYETEYKNVLNEEKDIPYPENYIYKEKVTNTFVIGDNYVYHKQVITRTEHHFSYKTGEYSLTKTETRTIEEKQYYDDKYQDKDHIALSDSKFYSKVSVKRGPNVVISVEVTEKMSALVREVLLQKEKAERIIQGINDMNQDAQDNIEQVRMYETDDQDILPIDWGRKRK
ncbi:RHS Repeat protein [compost metagenome]